MLKVNYPKCFIPSVPQSCWHSTSITPLILVLHCYTVTLSQNTLSASLSAVILLWYVVKWSWHFLLKLLCVRSLLKALSLSYYQGQHDPHNLGNTSWFSDFFFFIHCILHSFRLYLSLWTRLFIQPLFPAVIPADLASLAVPSDFNISSDFFWMKNFIKELIGHVWSSRWNQTSPWAASSMFGKKKREETEGWEAATAWTVGCTDRKASISAWWATAGYQVLAQGREQAAPMNTHSQILLQ